MLFEGDYTPFGMQMVGRQYNLGVGRYRYGFNGKENDNEVKGDGNQIDYGMRAYDPRIGKFLSVDPLQKQYPELTPYQFTANNPIENVDLDGKEVYNFRLDLDDKGHKTGFSFLGKNVGGLFGWSVWDMFGIKIPAVDVYQNGKIVAFYSFNSAGQGGLNTLHRFVNDEVYRNEYMGTVPTDGQKQSQHAVEIGNSVAEGFQTAAAVNYAISRIQTKVQTPTNHVQVTQQTNKQVTAAQGGNSNGAYTYAPRVRERAVQDPGAHNFPYSFDQNILKTKPIKEVDGSNSYILSGSMNGKDGFFILGVNERTKTIFHRSFESKYIPRKPKK